MSILKYSYDFFKERYRFLSTNYLIFNLQHFLILFISTCVLFWLSSSLNLFFNTYILETLFSWIPTEPLGYVLGSIYILLFSLIFYFLCQKYITTKYKPSLLLIGTLLIICFLYLNERLFIQQYYLTPIYSQNCLSHFPVVLDPIYISLLFFAVYFIYSAIRTKIPSWSPSFINPDQPINNKSLDEFERTDFIEKFSILLDGFEVNENQSFVIGINGKWGLGKSSLMIMIEKELKQINKESIIICFNPWITSNNANLIQSFFDLLDNRLSEHIATNNIFSKYGKSLTKIDHEKNFLKPFYALFNEKSIQANLSKITSIIKKIHKPVYIFIDDIDRLNKEEVFEVLRLIRNSACFPNMKFIAAYDRTYLEEALEKYQIPNHKKYLEKIIQLEVNVPSIQQISIKNILMNELRNKIKYVNLNDVEKEEALKLIQRMIFGDDLTKTYNKFKIHEILNDLFFNKRDIVRFANSFILHLIISYNNIYIPDLFILELIKSYNLDLYFEMVRKEKLYAVYREKDSTLKFFSLQRNKEKDIEYFDFGEPQLLKIIENKFKNDSTLIQLVEALISKTLPSDPKNDLGIYYDDYYDSYFTLVAPKNVVTTNFIRDLIKGNEE